MQEIFRETETHMKKAVDHLHQEMKRLRTGRASPAILEGVQVDYYGTPTPLQQLANVTVSDAQMLVAQPYDTSQISAMEKAIQTADLGLNPSNDGQVIRIPIPALTEERRKTLVRQAHEMTEASRNSIRQARREGNDQLKKKEKAKEISEDDLHRGLDDVQKLHDHYIKQAGEALEHKEKDIMTL